MEPEFFYNLEQGTPEWHEIRRGIPTASEFATVMVDGKGRRSYAKRLAGEILCGAPAEQNFTRPWLERGKEMEDEARKRFERKLMVDVRRCGFVRRQLRSGRYVGCSPDALFEVGGLQAVLEIKTMRPEFMIDWRESGYNPHELPTEYVSQCLGNLLVTGYQRVDLFVWYRGMPFDLHYTAFRHEAQINATIERMTNEVERFDGEVHAIVQKAKGEWSK